MRTAAKTLAALAAAGMILAAYEFCFDRPVANPRAIAIVDDGPSHRDSARFSYPVSERTAVSNELALVDLPNTPEDSHRTSVEAAPSTILAEPNIDQLFTELEEKYADRDLSQLRTALHGVNRLRETIAEPLLQAKFLDGRYLQGDLVEGEELYEVDVAAMHRELQPVLCVRLEPLEGTDAKVPKVARIDPEEDPELLLASLEQLWLRNRIHAMESPGTLGK